MSQVDELFGEGSGAPAPRTQLVRRLLVSGLVLAAFGLACTSVPGGLLVLAAWTVVETEMGRVENGYLPADTHADVQRAHRQVSLALSFVLVLFGIQSVLVCSGTYDVFWTWVVASVSDLLGLRG